MLLATLVPKLIGFRACIPRTLSATLSSSSSSSSDSISELRHGNAASSGRQLRPLTLEESLQLSDPTDNLHAAHCLLYCKTVDNDVECMFGLCQVRFDGLLGFPGGVVKRKGNVSEKLQEADIIEELERELLEEIGYSPKPNEFNSDDETRGYTHISSYIDEHCDRSDSSQAKRVNVFHFFVKQIGEQEFKQLEESHTKSQHFPLEALGLFRIPLIDPINCSDQTVFRYYKQRGSFLANFLKSNFAGIGRVQLFDALVKLDCLTPDYLSKLESIIRHE